MRWRYVVAMLALGGCSKAPDVPPTTRPEWRSAAIDGIAPLMTPREVAAALTRRGYRQVACLRGEKLFIDPLERGSEMPCYDSPRSPMRLTLYFLELREGRRLAVVNFNQTFADGSNRAERSAANRAFAKRLRGRFGRPSIIDRTPRFLIVYWFRPGGQPSLPDMIRTDIDHHSGANVSMTSMWAYSQVRPTT